MSTMVQSASMFLFYACEASKMTRSELTTHAVDYDQEIFILVFHVVSMALHAIPASDSPNT